MTADYARMTCDEFLDLAAASALDVIHPDDQERLDRHAQDCALCAARLADFQEVAAGLGSEVPQVDPPAELKLRIVDRARDERPAIVYPRRMWPRLLPRPRIAAAWLVAAASLAMSVGAMAWVVLLQGQITQLQNDAMVARDRAARYDHVVQVMASERLAVRPLQPAVQDVRGWGMVFMDPSSGTGMLLCRNLPPVEQGHAYQVWFTRGTERVSGGLIWPDHSGNGYAVIQVPSDLQSFDSVGLTDEPGTGSKWPTTPRVVGAPLKESSQ